QDRTAATADFLRDVVEYVLDQTDAVARNLDMVSLPQLYNRTGQQVSAACHGWYRTVVESHFAYVGTMRGHNPPAFLEERARIDRIVAKVAAKRAAAKRSRFAAARLAATLATMRSIRARSSKNAGGLCPRMVPT